MVCRDYGINICFHLCSFFLIDFTDKNLGSRRFRRKILVHADSAEKILVHADSAEKILVHADSADSADYYL